ncbi:MAG: hypothetical protein Q9195_005152 [Heterodermia aff. obscurata]
MASRVAPTVHLVEETDRSPSFPRDHHLLVTTSVGVYSWDSDGVTRLFRSGSGAIVAARKARNVLAIADGQVVILHDIDKGLQKRSYRLKGSDGQIGLLQYMDNTATLYFTTTLQNAVQAYSMDTFELLDPAPTHPSRPNVFALSSLSHLLLSTSCRPPTIYLTDLSRHSPPIPLRPQCSASAVAAAAFHPERENVFALAFADGTLAVYSAIYLTRENANVPRGQRSMDSYHVTEVGFIKRVHATTSQVQSSSGQEGNSIFRGYDPGTETTGIGNIASGIAAIAFVPSLKATLMSVGADGKCCVTDFAVSKRQDSHRSNIRIVRSWHLGSAGTSLALCCTGQLHAPAKVVNGRNRPSSSGSDKVLAAIGLQNSKVIVYNIEGILEGQHTFDPNAPCVRVAGIEWAATNNDRSRPKIRSRQPSSRRKRKSLGSVLAAGRVIRKDIIPDTGNQTRSDVHSTTTTSSRSASLWAGGASPELSTSVLNGLGLLSGVKAVEPTVVSQPGTHQPTLGHMDLFSPFPTTISDSTEYQTAKETFGSSTSLVQATKETKQEIKRRGIVGTDRLSEQSSESTTIKTIQPPNVPPRPTPKPGGRLYLRRAQTSGTNVTGAHQAGSSKHSKSLGIMRNTLHKRGSKTLSPQKATVSLGELADGTRDEAWTDIEPNADRKPLPDKDRVPRAAALSPNSHPSEGSNDTIVDWSANTSLPPAPTRTTTLETAPPMKPAPTSMASPSSQDAVVQSSSLKKSPRIVDIHNSLHLDDAVSSAKIMSPPPLPDRAAPNLPPRAQASSALDHLAAHTDQNGLHPVANTYPNGAPQPVYQDLVGVLQQSLHRELKLFHREIMYQFDVQKAWFRNETRERDVWIQRLEEENGRLRRELGRVVGRRR